MIPMKYDEDGNLEEVDAYNPFMRGVMEFDDYNYAVHNPYVLVEDPKHIEAAAAAELKKREGGKLIPVKNSSPKGTSAGFGEPTFS